jgi:hypothetical protein
MLKDKTGTVCDADYSPSKSTMGLSEVVLGSATGSSNGPGVPSVALLVDGARTEEQLVPPLRQQHAAIGQLTMHAPGELQGQLLLSAGAGGARDEKRADNAAVVGHSASATSGRGCRDLVGPGSSVPTVARSAMVAPMLPQKIQTFSGGPMRWTGVIIPQ